jgi:hypothetical protein
MPNLTKKTYEQQAKDCDGLCEVPVTKQQVETGELPCVRCPFCKQIVTAVLTPTTISCPACKIEVAR